MRLIWVMVSPRVGAAWISACRARVRAARPAPGAAGAACSAGGVGSQVWRRFLQAGAVPGDGAFYGLGQVVPWMPPIGDLDGQRRARSSVVGVAAAVVPADDLHARVGIQPGAEGFRGPLGQHVHRPAGLDVEQHGPVDMPLVQRKIIHAQRR